MLCFFECCFVRLSRKMSTATPKFVDLASLLILVYWFLRMVALREKLTPGLWLNHLQFSNSLVNSAQYAFSLLPAFYRNQYGIPFSYCHGEDIPKSAVRTANDFRATSFSPMAPFRSFSGCSIRAVMLFSTRAGYLLALITISPVQNHIPAALSWTAFFTSAAYSRTAM